MKKNQYVEHILDLLEPFGGIKARAMFGGHGIYKDGIFFALIIDNLLYFKVDDTRRANYEKHGSKPFTYERKDKKSIAMSYWEVPIEILEDRDELEIWVDVAVKAAQRARKAKNGNKKLSKEID